jgi:hypothetical protein
MPDGRRVKVMQKRVGELCECGSPLPWHLVGCGPVPLVHICSCERQWRADAGPPKIFKLVAAYDESVEQPPTIIGIDFATGPSKAVSSVVLSDVPPERAPKVVWFFGESKGTERYTSDPYDTEEEAAAAARKEYDGVRDDFAVMQAEEVLVDAVAVAVATDVDQLLEMMEDHAADNCGNEDTIFSIADGHTAEEAEEVLEVFMAAWARKYLRCGWYAGMGKVKTMLVHPPLGEPEYEEPEE